LKSTLLPQPKFGIVSSLQGVGPGLQLLIEQHLGLRQLQLSATRVLRKLSKEQRHKELAKLLNSVPGVALLTLMLLITEIIDTA